MKPYNRINVFVFLLFLLLTFGNAHAAKPVYVGGKERAAVRGYDVVAYFTESQPVKGSMEFELQHAGTKWLFSSQKNIELFKNNPDKYMPQFGGYCAYAVARGTTASSKPEYFTIHEDKLYLNYSKSVYKRWIKDKDSYIAKANSNWPAVIEK